MGLRLLLITSLVLLTAATSFDPLASTTFERASFVQTRELAALDHPLISKGTVSLTPQGFIWHQREPFENRLTFDGNLLVEQIHLGDEVIEQPQNDPISLSITRSMYQMMSGSLANLKENFHVSMIGDQEVGWTAKLVPIDERVGKFLSRIVLEGDRYLNRISVEQTNGVSTLIELSDQE